MRRRQDLIKKMNVQEHSDLSFLICYNKKNLLEGTVHCAAGINYKLLEGRELGMFVGVLNP